MSREILIMIKAQLERETARLESFISSKKTLSKHFTSHPDVKGKYEELAGLYNLEASIARVLEGE